MPTVTLESRRTNPAARAADPLPQTAAVLIVHTDELMLLGAQSALKDQAWVAHCVLARTADEAVLIAERIRPRVAVIRADVPDAPALVQRLRDAHPDVQVVTFGETRAIRFAESVRAAASGTTPDEVYSLTAPTTGPAVSTREVEVLQHLATGASNSEIAGRLFLSPHTVKQHVRRICRKLGARNRVEAISKARAIGVLG